jgi:hypothetical protein
VKEKLKGPTTNEKEPKEPEKKMVGDAGFELDIIV